MMASADGIVLTDGLLIKISKAIPLDKIDEVFVELGFDITDIDKRRVVAHQSMSLNNLILGLLSSWKNKHGDHLEEALKLKEVMNNQEIDSAVKLIQEAINKVLPSPPQPDMPDNVSESSSSSERDPQSPMECS